MTASDDCAAAGRDRLRAGHADRERVVETLKTAFVDGRLTSEELDTRTGHALLARTYADLAALTADIPPVAAPVAAAPVSAALAPVAPAPPAPVRRPARRRSRPLARAVAQSGGCLAAAFALWLVAGSGPRNIFFILNVLAVALFVVAVAAVGNGVIKASDQRRTRGTLPSGRGRGGPAHSAVRPGDGPAALRPRADDTPADLRARKAPEYRQRRGTRSVELGLTS